jgi:integrase
MRPEGGYEGVYLRGSIYWISYSRNGHQIRESAETDNEKKAWQLRLRRLEEAKRPEFVGPAERKLDLEDLQKKIEADYERHSKRSLKTAQYCLKPVKEYFKYDRLVEITPQRIEAYQTKRLKTDGMARATVNREVRYLLHGFRLLSNAHEINYVPMVKLLEGENVREGFLNRPEFEAICERIKSNQRIHPVVQDISRFLYLCSWRSGEAKNLEWSKFDQTDWLFRLPRKSTKNKRPRTLVLVGELREIIERRLADRRPDCPYVFHRNGKQIKDFRKAFKAAAKLEGLDGLVPHDMRRSGIRNFIKAGVDESEGMSISGHETNSTYKRYGIIDEGMQRTALERVHEQQQREKEEGRKVIPIRQAG